MGRKRSDMNIILKTNQKIIKIYAIYIASASMSESNFHFGDV